MNLVDDIDQLDAPPRWGWLSVVLLFAALFLATLAYEASVRCSCLPPCRCDPCACDRFFWP